MDGAPNICGAFEGWFYICAFDETLRQVEFGAEEAFAAGHLASVGFVVVTGEMEQAMENENFDFGGE
jgi:hypothetical protein